MTTVSCFDIYGNAVAVPQSSVTFSPAAYGVLIEHDRVLVGRHPITGLLLLPGGQLSGEQSPESALRDDLSRVLGAAPRIGKLLMTDQQYQIDQEGKAWHLSIMYYSVAPPPLGAQGQVAAGGRWEMLPFSRLERSQMQTGYDAVVAARAKLRP